MNNTSAVAAASILIVIAAANRISTQERKEGGLSMLRIQEADYMSQVLYIQIVDLLTRQHNKPLDGQRIWKGVSKFRL